MEDAERAIRTMIVRGAPLIGAAAAYGMALAMASRPVRRHAGARLPGACSPRGRRRSTCAGRSTTCARLLAPLPPAKRREAAYRRAAEICDEDAEICRRIGEHGLARDPAPEAARRSHQRADPLQRGLARHRRLGHRDWRRSTRRTMPGMPIHVWVDETRPRNQGASLTAWELGQHGVPHTVIADNAGGHLMQHGQVDFVHRRHRPHDARAATSATRSAPISRRWPRTTTACRSMSALPYPSIDWTIEDGSATSRSRSAMPTRSRASPGRTDAGEVVTVDVLPEGSPAANPAFDVTPARLVHGADHRARRLRRQRSRPARRSIPSRSQAA